MNKLALCAIVVCSLSACTMDSPFVKGPEVTLNPVKPKCGEQGSDCLMLDGARFKASSIVEVVDDEVPTAKKKKSNKISREDAEVVMKKGASKSWTIKPDDVSVQFALSRWAKEAGWQFVWEAPRDFPVTVTATFTGTFDEAISGVVKSLATSDMPVRACTNMGNKPPLLRIVTVANQCDR